MHCYVINIKKEIIKKLKLILILFSIIINTLTKIKINKFNPPLSASYFKDKKNTLPVIEVRLPALKGPNRINFGWMFYANSLEQAILIN